MASIIKADTLQSTTANVFVLNSSGTEYARFDSTGVFQLTNPTTFPAGTAALPSITATGDTNTGIFFPAADTIAFAEGGAEAARLDSSGNFGLGVTPSAWDSTVRPVLSVKASTGSFSFGASGVDNARFLSNAYYSGGFKRVAAGYASQYEQNAGTHIWYTAGTSTADSAITFTEAARIDSSGNVGIGTTSPARRLHVKAAGVTTLGNSNGALFTDASNAGVLLGSDNAIGYISGVTVTGSATANLVLQPFGGNAMVGTTTTRGKLYIHYDSNSSADPTVYFGNDGGTGVFASFGSAAGTVIGTIARSGSSTNYNTSSDYRLKNTIAPMTGALAKVGLLKPVTYKWNLDGGESQGFIAHELQTVVPECVTGEKDAVQEEQYEVTPAVKDEEGNIVTAAVMGTRNVPVYQGIDTSFLVATLTAAIQEQQALIQALTATTTSQTEAITALTARIAALESTP